MSDVSAILTTFLGQVFDRFENEVAARHAVRELRLELAGRAVRIRTAGDQLAGSFEPALAHVRSVSTVGPPTDLDIVAWDATSTGIPGPKLPWRIPGLPPGTRLTAPAAARGFRIAGATPADGVHLFDPVTGRAAWLLPDAAHLPTFHYAVPLLTIFKWWAPGVGLRLLHAGSIASGDRAVLLCGAGGSGKSTTCLLSALAGLDYLADDICLLRPGPRPEAISLYNSGKLHRDHLRRFPALASRAIDPEPDPFEKPVVFVERHFPERVVRSRPLRGILASRVSGRPDTAIEPIAPGEALRALAPSTFVQLSPDDPGTFRDLAALVRQVPCFRLHLGLDTEGIAPRLRALVDSLS